MSKKIKKLKLRVGDLLLTTANAVGVVLELSPGRGVNDRVVVYWFASDYAQSHLRDEVQYWRQNALDRRAEFM